MGHRTFKRVILKCPLALYISTFLQQRARSMHDVAVNCVRSRDAQKQLARTSLTRVNWNFAEQHKNLNQLANYADARGNKFSLIWFCPFL